eukprot:gb/GEZJ01001467.1/.p1 GENE.gb/GEZJ01001467.1/~~gb/GEZJ01001467.1/.p1  ORF type:complete len:108 (+),score=4.78 gb/GEZJ01001467.1/:518-841(+)
MKRESAWRRKSVDRGFAGIMRRKRGRGDDFEEETGFGDSNVEIGVVQCVKKSNAARNYLLTNISRVKWELHSSNDDCKSLEISLRLAQEKIQRLGKGIRDHKLLIKT